MDARDRLETERGEGGSVAASKNASSVSPVLPAHACTSVAFHHNNYPMDSHLMSCLRPQLHHAHHGKAGFP